MFGIINSTQCHTSVLLMEEVATSLTKQTLFGLLITVRLENAQVFFLFLFCYVQRTGRWLIMQLTMWMRMCGQCAYMMHVFIHHRYSRFFKYFLNANQFKGRIYMFSSWGNLHLFVLIFKLIRVKLQLSS